MTTPHRRRTSAGTIVAAAALLFGVAAPAPAQKAYVGNYFGGVSVIDTVTNTLQDVIPTGLQPWGIAIAPGGAYVYVSDNGSDAVSFIGTSTNTVLRTVGVGSRPMGIAVLPTGDRLYVGNALVGTVSVVDTITGIVTDTIFTSGAFGVAAHPTNRKVYVAGANQVAVIDTTTNSVVTAIPVGNDPRGIAVDPRGAHTYTADFASDTVSVIDVATEAVVASVPVGDGPWGIAVSPDGARAYATNLYDRTVSVIDTATNTVVATTPVSGSPLGISVHPGGARVYVACTGAPHALCVIDAASNTELYQVPTGGASPIGLGQFIGGPTAATAASTPAATGVLTILTNGSSLTGTLAFDPGVFGVFGTAVDLAAALGNTPMTLTGSLVSLPGGLGVSATATSSVGPTFSLGGTGTLALRFAGGLAAQLTMPLRTPTGTVLPAGPAYTLDSALLGLGAGTYQGPFTLTASVAANTPASPGPVTIPVTGTVTACPGSVLLETPVSVTFAQVASSGSTLVTGTCQTPGSIPPNVRVDFHGSPFFFDVSTTAGYTGPVTVCVGYPAGLAADATTLILLHDAGGQGNFQPVRNPSVDTTLHRVCGEVDSLSPFALGTLDSPTGTIPPDGTARKCAHTLLTEASKLVGKTITCNRRAAYAALVGKPFDAAGCKATARTKYDLKTAGAGSCPACTAANAPQVGDAAAALAATVHPALYCAGSTPLGGDNLGFVPPDKATASCATREGASLATLAKRLATCARHRADAAMTGHPFDADGCRANATGRFDLTVSMLTGCPACMTGGAPAARNQIERFGAGILADVYCAGTVPVP